MLRDSNDSAACSEHTPRAASAGATGGTLRGHPLLGRIMVRSDPTPLDAHTRRRMEQQRRRDTLPELAIRRAAHARGLRYLVDRAPLPGMRTRADLLFPRRQVAVFVDGCFWHRCPSHGTSPVNNAAWWETKLAENESRDRRVNARLTGAGWAVIRIWEHEDPGIAVLRIIEAVQRPDRNSIGLPPSDHRLRCSK